MDTRFKGEIARLKVVMRAIEKGWIPSTPVIEQARYDLILDDGKVRHRVQIKYTDTESSIAENAYYVNLRRRNKGSSEDRVYTADEVDAVIVYVAKMKKSYWIPTSVFDGRSTLSIRTAPAKNGQTKGCLLASDYEW